FGSVPMWSSSGPTVATNPRLVASSAMAWARPSAVPRLEPYSTSSGIWCASAVGVGSAAGSEATAAGREAVNGGGCRASGSGPDLNVEVVGLDGERLLGFELVVGEVD